MFAGLLKAYWYDVIHPASFVAKLIFVSVNCALTLHFLSEDLQIAFYDPPAILNNSWEKSESIINCYNMQSHDLISPNTLSLYCTVNAQTNRY